MVSVGLGSLGSKVSIAGYKVPILVPLIGVAALAFYALRKSHPPGPPKVAVAPDVNFMLNPPEIKPNTPTQLTGQFIDEMGKPVQVKAGYYYIFLADPKGTQKLIQQGSLGMDISSFNIPINTSGFQPPGMGHYSITVTDEPLSQQELISGPAEQPIPMGGAPSFAALPPGSPPAQPVGAPMVPAAPMPYPYPWPPTPAPAPMALPAPPLPM